MDLYCLWFFAFRYLWPNSFLTCLITDTTNLHILMPVLMTLTFVQVTVVQESGNFYNIFLQISLSKWINLASYCNILVGWCLSSLILRDKYSRERTLLCDLMRNAFGLHSDAYISIASKVSIVVNTTGIFSWMTVTYIPGRRIMGKICIYIVAKFSFHQIRWVWHWNIWVS